MYFIVICSWSQTPFFCSTRTFSCSPAPYFHDATWQLHRGWPFTQEYTDPQPPTWPSCPISACLSASIWDHSIWLWCWFDRSEAPVSSSLEEMICECTMAITITTGIIISRVHDCIVRLIVWRYADKCLWMCSFFKGCRIYWWKCTLSRYGYHLTTFHFQIFLSNCHLLFLSSVFIFLFFCAFSRNLSLSFSL